MSRLSPVEAVARFGWRGAGRYLGVPHSTLHARHKGTVRSPLAPGRLDTDPTTKGERAYRLREQGRSWSAVGEEIGSSKSGAGLVAQWFAQHNGLPWPPRAKR